MPNFSLSDEIFERAAEEFRTPFHLYDEAGLRRRARRLNAAFSWCPDFREYFAVKALPNPAILRILKEEGCGLDCSSATELTLAKACGFSGEEVILSANAMPPEEFAQARALGAYINLDDISDIETLRTHGGIPECVCLRYNPGGNFSIGNTIMGNPGEAKYGFMPEQLKEGLRLLKGEGVTAFGLRAFTLFKDSKMCVFFIFSFLLGMCLQVTNGFATPYLDDFGKLPEYANAFAVKNNVFLSSISQVSETLCILLIPFCLKRFGIKKVMLISFVAWFLRFGLLGAGSPTGFGLVLFILSMIVYGVAFDFFNISGSLFVDQNTDERIRSSAQGVFMMMTNGLGATIGSLCAQAVVNHYTAGKAGAELMSGWSSAWYVFALFALVLAFLFAAVFKYKHEPQAK